MNSHPAYGDSERRAAEPLIRLALAEDLADIGDITTRALIAANQSGSVQIVARQTGILAGVSVAQQVFEGLDSQVQFVNCLDDGAALGPGTVVAELYGSLRSLLTGERTALNFISHLSGVASLTRRYVDAVAGTRARIYDTRKTLPGWRVLEKYAVRIGGGCNHRMGLFDMVLIKDNHIAGWKVSGVDHSIASAVRAARDAVGPDVAIEVEVESPAQLHDALDGRPDLVLLDNMPTTLLRQAVAIRDARAPQVVLEASGGVSLASVADIARAGVERISSGALTHSAVALDLAFDWK
ncbi:MAG: carboxylating nicotinate-nucleotide diphosphorylase [Planctomycetaceae bacterium]|nr:carboxylating nicotinate-nucleotide diphosphorylase [Planctomycetaceae bacterium]